jgi:methyl-accepting chemotaxis protein
MGLLILLAAFVLGLGLYGLMRLNDSVENYVRISNRSQSLNDIAILTLKLSIEEKDLIIETDDAKIKATIESDEFKNYRANAETAMKVVAETVSQTSQQWAKDLLVSIPPAIEAFDDATEVVADLARKNTITQAKRLLYANAPLWAAYIEKVTPILEIARKPGQTEIDDESEKYMLGLSSYRLDIQRVAREILVAENQEEREVAIKAMRDGFTSLLGQLRRGTDIFSKKPQWAAIFPDLIAQISKIQENAEKVADLAIQDSNGKAYVYSSTEARKCRDALNAILNDAIAISSRQQQGIRDDTVSLADSLFWTMIIASVIGIAVAGVIAFIVVRSITSSLNRIIGELDNGSTEVTSAASEISNSSQSLAEGATEQAASLEETSSALEQMASMTRQNADNAHRTSETTAAMVKLIGEGAVAVQNMSSAMAEINESAEQINRIIKTIEDIAFQTNLLALNAAVEAARAGEAGKGFAVVADEVRNLAQRSAQAARDTTALIESTVTRVHNGGEIAAKLDASFKEIQEGSDKVGGLIKEITSATHEQAQGVDQVNTAVAQMDKVTQSNAASAEESASSSEQLSAQADALKNLVEDLLSLVAGAGAQRGDAVDRPAPRQRQAQSVKPSRRPQRSLPSSSGSKASSGGEGRKVMKPDDVIPLDGDFGDF